MTFVCATFITGLSAQEQVSVSLLLVTGGLVREQGRLVVPLVVTLSVQALHWWCINRRCNNGCGGNNRRKFRNAALTGAGFCSDRSRWCECRHITVIEQQALDREGAALAVCGVCKAGKSLVSRIGSVVVFTSVGGGGVRVTIGLHGQARGFDKRCPIF
jgi:hypothetical protein